MRVGRHLVGLRLSTAELADAARQVLRPSLVPDVVAPPNVSVLAADAHAGTGLVLCYRSSTVVTRAWSIRRALESAVTLLSSYDASAADGLVAIPALVAVRDGHAALFSPECRRVLDSLGPRLGQRGWALADTVTALIDPATVALIVPRPPLVVDDATLRRLPRHRREPQPATPGRYHVGTWVSVAGEGSPPDTRAARVARVASTVDVEETPAQVVLEAVTALLGGAVWVTSPQLDAAALAAALRSATP